MMWVELTLAMPHQAEPKVWVNLSHGFTMQRIKVDSGTTAYTIISAPSVADVCVLEDAMTILSMANNPAKDWQRGH